MRPISTGRRRPIWSDGQGLFISALGEQLFEVEFSGIGTFRIDCARKLIHCSDAVDFGGSDTFHHLVFDQLVPRIRAHDGAFVLHAAAILRSEAAFLLVGVSGQGKSTLAAALDRSGAELLGDDAAVLALAEGAVTARSIYRSLRLLPDSLQAVVGPERPSQPMAHYSAKRRLVEDARPARGAVPLAAIFVLAPAGEAGEGVSFEPLQAPEACMNLLRETFALDPSDTARAATRLQQASAVAERVPAFRLHYPRDYARLAEVAATVLDKVDMLR